MEKTRDVRKVTTRKHEKPELLPEGTAWMSKRSSASLQYLQMEDEHVGPIVKWKSEGRKPTKEEVVKYSLTTKHYVCLWEQIKLIDGVLYKNCSTTLGQNLTQLQVPEKLKPEILQLCHCSLLSGHLGLKKTKFRITKQFYWYEIRDSIKIFIQSCDTCASNKKTNRTPKAKLGSYPVGVPWERLGVDFLGPLPVTKQGNRYILVCIDYFSKWTEAVAVPDQTARTTAKVLLEMVSRFGCPVTLHSDQGRNFESNLISELCIFLQIKKTRTTPRNPKGNDLVERFNRTLIQMVRAYIISDDEWDLYLSCMASAYRSTPQESTGLTPNMLIFVNEVRLPSEVIYPPVTSTKELTSSYGTYVEEIRNQLNKAHEICRRHLGHAAERQRKLYDSKTCPHKYATGDLVWKLNENIYAGECAKLQPVYVGPCVVIKTHSDLVFEIQLDARGQRKVVNHNKLLPHHGSQPPKWAQKIAQNLKKS